MGDVAGTREDAGPRKAPFHSPSGPSFGFRARRRYRAISKRRFPPHISHRIGRTRRTRLLRRRAVA